MTRTGTRRRDALERRSAKYRRQLAAAPTPAARVTEDIRYLASVAAAVITHADPAVTTTVRQLIRDCAVKVTALADPSTRRTR